MRAIGWLLVLVFGVAAVLTLNPDWLGVLRDDWSDLTTTFPISQAIALRPLLFGVFAVLAVVVLVTGVFRLVRMHRGARTLTLGLVLALVALGHGWTVWDRGLDGSTGLSADDGLRSGEPGTGALTVLTYNTQGGATSPEDLADIVVENGVDVVALPEISEADAQELAGLLAHEGAAFQFFVDATGESDIGSTALLVEYSLGEYLQVDGPDTQLGSVRVEPADGAGPVLVAVHPVSPRERLTEQWRKDLDAVMSLCTARRIPGLVLAGDFNATRDHAPLQDLGSCADAAELAGAGGVSTWPVTAPTWLGSAIDHVLIDDAAFEATEAAVVETGRSDHRGVLVRLQPVD
ncbi:endonuclease/exonuclease/phosphatase family protein [Georgenia sp. 10Sc9-8]|uniref:Endonuclease/exonuclease/phosphatase family protein n=1 Tax=Georgenia halotolerans TaxID=3028317 RepID=A0ABT5U2N7_9MICO|nr:endonuclease/exonuclease/phosphatase family protein [Georgenia halotolerans]